MKYVIFTDIDGTLYPLNHIVPEKNKQAIKEAQQKGVEVVLCTGNGYFQQVENLAKELNIRYCITSNGASIFDRQKGEFIYASELNQEHVNELLKVSLSKEIPANWWGKKDLSVNPHTSEDVKHLIKRVMGRKPKISTEIEEDVFKIEFYAKKEQIDEIMKHIDEDKFEAARMKDVHVEVTKKEVSKGHAIKWFASHFDLDVNDFMGIGDSANDLTMLQTVGFSYAMANGSDLVKQTAKYHAAAVDQNGMGEAVIDYLFRNKNGLK